MTAKTARYGPKRSSGAAKGARPLARPLARRQNSAAEGGRPREASGITVPEAAQGQIAPSPARRSCPSLPCPSAKPPPTSTTSSIDHHALPPPPRHPRQLRRQHICDSQRSAIPLPLPPSSLSTAHTLHSPLLHWRSGTASQPAAPPPSSHFAHRHTPPR